MKPKDQSFDVNKAKKSLDTLFGIFADISNNADELLKSRCPYKNAKSRCTAKFECKNQHYVNQFGALTVCTGSDFLDYRSAWQTDKKRTY